MSKRNSNQDTHQRAYQLLESVSGPMDYTMTNDFMFKAVLQRNNQIGFLDFTLFPDSPEFFAKHLLMNRKTHKIYTDKLCLYVIDLSRMDLATEEDRLYEIDEWAKLFKTKTWEDLKVLAKTNDAFAEAGATIYEISADEHLRQQLEAREDALRQERGMLRRLENAEKKLGETVAKLDAATTQLADTTAERDQATAERDQATAERDEAYARIAELEKKLAISKTDPES